MSISKMWNNQNKTRWPREVRLVAVLLGVVAADVGFQTHLSHNIVMSRSRPTLVTLTLATHRRTVFPILHSIFHVF